MILNCYRGKQVVCDNCGEGFETDGTFKDAMQLMKEMGWKTKVVDNVYRHYCSECVEEEK